MSVMEKMTRAQIENALSGVTYQSAINHYNNLKTRFLKEYQIAADKLNKELISDFEQEIISEFNNNVEDISAQEQLVGKLFSEVADALMSKLEGNNQLSNKRKQYKEQYKANKQRMSNEIKKAADEVLNDQELAKIIIQFLSAQKGPRGGSLAASGVSIEDILNQVRSYRNKVYIGSAGRRTSSKHYKRTTKGYLREAVVHKAFSDLTDWLDQKTVLHVGSRKSSSGIDTVYDEYIDFLNSVEGSFYANVNENIDAGYGLQVKSWIAPWVQKSYFNSYSVGARAELLEMFNNTISPGELYAWIKGVIFLENHIIQAMGSNQVAYITGDGFYWLGDLISQFRSSQYYYAFVFNKEHKATKSTSWQQINENA